MTSEILLKAYVQYQSEDALRELVASTLDEVYSTSLRIVHGTPHLAEDIAVRVYLELARKAPTLGEDVVLTSWLRERTCKIAVTVLSEEHRPVDREVLKREKKAPSTAITVEPAPAGLAINICSRIFLSAAPNKSLGLFSTAWWPDWIRWQHLAGLAVCVLTIIIWRTHPFHRRTPIVMIEGSQITPSSFAQLGSPDDGKPATPGQMTNTNGGINPKQK